MAHHKSAIRQERRSIRRKAVNTRNTSALRTGVKKVREAIENKDQETARKLLPGVISTIDQAVKKGTIHKNTGSRYKSRLSRQVVGMGVSPAK
ncbi:MAG: 30S ribosomal protein S20 [Candidatus Aminicenantales bacterium]|jgi:small subunit ribosomal protein S20